jgi:hypothetical protein
MVSDTTSTYEPIPDLAERECRAALLILASTRTAQPWSFLTT